MTDPKAREWYNRWVQENFFGSSRNTVDSLTQLLLQVQAEGRLAEAKFDVHEHDKLCETRRQTFVPGFCGCHGRRIAALEAELRSAQAGAEGGNNG